MIFHSSFFREWRDLNLMIRVNRYVEENNVTASPMQCKIWPPAAKAVETTDESDKWSGIYGYDFLSLTSSQVAYMRNLIDLFAHGKGHLLLLDYERRTAKQTVNAQDFTSDKFNVAQGESFVFSDEVIATRANIIVSIEFDHFFDNYTPFLQAYKKIIGK